MRTQHLHSTCALTLNIEWSDSDCEAIASETSAVRSAAGAIASETSAVRSGAAAPPQRRL